jgi:polyhydroxyalkanoate synthesis repressor PhaR
MNEGMNMEVQNNTNTMGANVATVSNLGTVSQSVGGKTVKVIKRYQNRKLYDTHQSCYVTLDEISDMIMRAEEVLVIDNRSKKDITSATLTQIIFEKQKRSKAAIPVETLRDIIQVGGGTFSGFLVKAAESGWSVLNRAKADLEKIYAGEAGSSERLRGAFKITQTAAEDLKKALDERAKSPAVSREALGAALSQLANMGTQLVNIEKLIDAVEARAAAADNDNA